MISSFLGAFALRAPRALLSWISLLCGAFALAALAASTSAHANPAQAAGVAAMGTSAVGQVSLLIGQVKVMRKDGAVEPLRRGMAVHVGDRVETSANGHVHLRFVDNAALSVRPDSVLEIQAYLFDSSRPELSEVRLQVDQGVARSISGRATEVDKNRFRLNTPVAAIGVRGTDFIVQASDATLRASVAEGAIVVSAFGEGCTAAGLGPCAGAQGRQLSAEMSNLMVELQRGDKIARLVPVAGHLAPLTGPGADERLAALRAADNASRSAGLQAAEPYGQNDRVAADALVIASDRLYSPENLNRRANASPDAQLVWGRYLGASFNDNVSVPVAIARLDRHEGPGTKDLTLFRANDPDHPDRLLRSSEGQVEFQLTRGQATYQSNGVQEAATLRGTFQLDFARMTFGTALALSAPSAGATELRMAGNVRPDGTFSLNEGAGAALQSIAGAVSLNGKEAGYLFERGAGNGSFRGITLWGR